MQQKSIRRILKIQKKLGLDSYEIICHKKDIISALKVAFEGELFMLSTVLKIKDLMLTFLNTMLKQKLMNMIINAGILNMKKSRQLMIESYGITVIRTNPDVQILILID